MFSEPPDHHIATLAHENVGFDASVLAVGFGMQQDRLDLAQEARLLLADDLPCARLHLLHHDRDRVGLARFRGNARRREWHA